MTVATKSQVAKYLKEWLVTMYVPEVWRDKGFTDYAKWRGLRQ